MKDWLNDKKNLPIIGAVTGVLLVAAVYLVWMSMRGSAPSPPTETRTVYPTGPEQPMPMGAPGATPYAAAPPTATTTVQPAAATTTPEGKPGVKVSLLPSRADPFVPFDYKPLKYRPKPRIMLPPIGPLVTRWEDLGKPKPPDENVLPPQPVRRMAGVMHNGRVFAILETAGETIVVKPGDIVENGNVRVDAIEPDRIILSWLRTPKPIPIEVRLSEGTGAESGMAAPTETTPVTPLQGYGGGYGRSRRPSMTMPTD
jgi:hypothetical protein